MKPLVNRLGYVSVETTDPERLAQDTANVVGAREVGRENGAILMSSNERHAEFIIYKGKESVVRAVGLEAASLEAIGQVKKNVEAAGLRVLSTTPSLAGIEKSVTFATSEGHVFEVHTPMANDRQRRYAGPGVHPKCLDHINFTAENPSLFAEEMAATCGFILGERTSGYELSWLRAGDGRHHTIAAAKEASGVHHISWEFHSFEAFKGLGDNLGLEGRRLIWGPGRHGAGDNLFLYYKDAAGFLIECIAEMEVILDTEREARVCDPGEGLSNWRVLNQWGALPPLEWIRHHNRIKAI